MTDRRPQDVITQPHFLMLSGPYGAGKTHWIKEFLASKGAQVRDWQIVSFDAGMLEIAKAHGKRWEQAHADPELFEQASQAMKEQLKGTLAAGKNIVFDNTNTDLAWRGEVLNMVKDSGQNYFKVAVSMLMTQKDSAQRVRSRNMLNQTKGVEKFIEKDVARRRFERYASQEPPSLEEGFDLVVEVPAEDFKNKQWTKTIAGTFEGANRFK